MSTALRTQSKTVATLALLTLMLPVDVAVTAAALISSRLSRPAQPHHVAKGPRTVLISGGKMTKALHLCRAFAAAGHRVVLVETAKYRFTAHRFSNSVSAFHVVPPPTDPAYAQALLEIVQSEGVDLYVPVCSPLASRYDALAARTLAGHCEVLHGGADLVDLLDDKFTFARAAAAHGLGVPDTHLLHSSDDVAAFDFAAHPHEQYVLKNLAYDPVNRLDLTHLPRASAAETERFARSKPIDSDNPWILQEFVHGREWCTHTTAKDGRVLVYVCCPSSPFQVNYESVDHPDIEKWVRTFVAELGVTGQVSFDFIESPEGEIVAIECNPRTHSAITAFQDLPRLAHAYLDELPQDELPLVPPPDARPTYWFYHELWRMISSPRTVRERIRVVRSGRDAVFDRRDPLPYLLLHHVQIPLLLLGNLRHARSWTRIDFNIGKLVEPGGD